MRGTAATMHIRRLALVAFAAAAPMGAQVTTISTCPGSAPLRVGDVVRVATLPDGHLCAATFERTAADPAAAGPTHDHVAPRLPGTPAASPSATSPAPQRAPWPNEPAGLSQVSDYGFGDPIPVAKFANVGGGWGGAYNEYGFGSRTDDPTAPFSPPSVLQIRYPAGFAGGAAPFTAYVEGLPPMERVFAGFWWKASNGWHGHPSNVNKIAFLMLGNDALVFTMYGPPGGPYDITVVPEFRGINPSIYRPFAGAPKVALGAWHRIEITADRAAGTVRWWMDGKQLGSATMPFNAGGFTGLKFSPTWGGLGSAKAHEDFYWYDHVRLSGR